MKSKRLMVAVMGVFFWWAARTVFYSTGFSSRSYAQITLPQPGVEVPVSAMPVFQLPIQSREPVAFSMADRKIIPLPVGTLTPEQEKAIGELHEKKNSQIDPALIQLGPKRSLKVSPGFKKAEGKYYLLQFNENPLLSARQELKQNGILLLDPIPNDAYGARVEKNAVSYLESAIAQKRIRYASPYPELFKILPSFGGRLESNLDKEFRIVIYPFEPLSEKARGELSRRGDIEIRTVDESPVQFIYATGRGKAVLGLLSLDAVKYVEEELEPVLWNNDGSAGISSDFTIQNGYDGTGVTVAVVDTGISRTVNNLGNVIFHPDLPGTRIVDQWDYANGDAVAEDQQSHGTHVAGTVGGLGTNSPKWRGVAPGVNFAVYKIFGASGVANTNFNGAMQRSANIGAVVSQNSWGCKAPGGNGNYDSRSIIADNAVRGTYTNQAGNAVPMTVVIATGNDNALVSCPATAKNAISVAAAKDGNLDNVQSNFGVCNDTDWPPAQRVCFSNFGPLDIDGDGNTRVKPDVIALGVNITSPVPSYLPVNAGNLYGIMSGTSMATPHVSGVAAQLLQAMPALSNWPEIVKADIINAAWPAGNTKSQEGHGMVDGFRAIFNMAGSWEWPVTLGDSVSADKEKKTYTFQVPGDTQQVKVTLAWADPASSSGSDNVINDLDLRVFDSKKNVIGSSTSYDDTVERVDIDATKYAKGTWSVTVSAFKLTGTVPQNFGLVVSLIRAKKKTTFDVLLSNNTVKKGDKMLLAMQVWNEGLPLVGSYFYLKLPGAVNPPILPEKVRFYRPNDTVGMDYGLNEIYDKLDITKIFPMEQYFAVGNVPPYNYSRKAVWYLEVNTNGNPAGTHTLEAGLVAVNKAAITKKIKITVTP